MPKRFYKYKLLLDENMPPRQILPELNEHFDVKHISHDLKKPGITDAQVYEIALSQDRIILTFNTRDFKPLVGKEDDIGVIGLPDAWANSKLDSKLVALLIKKSPKFFKGKVRILQTIH